MSTTLSSRQPATAAASTSRLAPASMILGVVAALLTTTLAFISLAAGATAVVLGLLAARSGRSRTLAVIGITAALSSIYIVVLEIFVVG